MIDCVHDCGSIVILIWVCRNHFTYVMLLLLFLFCFWYAYDTEFMLFLKTYPCTSCKFCKSWFCQKISNGRLVFLMIWWILKITRSVQDVLVKERTHVGHDVITCVQHLTFISMPWLLLFWTKILVVFQSHLFQPFRNVLIIFVWHIE